MNPDRVNNIIDSYGADRAVCLAVLHDIQREYNYLPREALNLVAERLGISPGEIYRMATFYRSFTLRPKGDFCIRVCMGTACHVHGAARILDTFERELGIRAGDSTQDGLFSLEATACMGACAQAPYVEINSEPYAQMTTDQVSGVLEHCSCAVPGTA